MISSNVEPASEATIQITNTGTLHKIYIMIHINYVLLISDEAQFFLTNCKVICAFYSSWGYPSWKEK